MAAFQGKGAFSKTPTNRNNSHTDSSKTNSKNSNSNNLFVDFHAGRARMFEEKLSLLC